MGQPPAGCGRLFDPDGNDGLFCAAARLVLAGLGGGCALPIAAYATLQNGHLTLQGRVSSLDGSRKIDVQGKGSLETAWELGINLAEQALASGAGDLLEGMALHCFEGRPPFSEDTLKKIEQLKQVYDLDLEASDSHDLNEGGQKK